MEKKCEESEEEGEDLSMTVAEMTLDSLGSPVFMRKPRKKRKPKRVDKPVEREENEEEADCNQGGQLLVRPTRDDVFGQQKLI
jgi:hypothetical protein